MNTDKLNDTIKARRLGGQSFRRIAKDRRLSVGSIAGRCHRMGLCQPPDKLREKSKALDAQIRELAEGSARNRDIALKLDLPLTTISSRTGRMEIPDRRRKSPERTTIRIRKPVEPRVVEPVPEPVRTPESGNGRRVQAGDGLPLCLVVRRREGSREQACMRGRDRSGVVLRLPRLARLRHT